MSIANIAVGPSGGEEYWEPTLTMREAARVEIPRREYEPAVLYARTTVEEHQRIGTRRDCWEPTASMNDWLAAPYLADGEKELGSRLKEDADPQLDQAQNLTSMVRESLDEAVRHTRPIPAPESGVSYSVAEAVDRVAQHDAAISWDEAADKHHHHRVNPALKGIAAATPWLEAIGFLTFITYYLNVPLLQPWQDWLGWSFGLTVVVVIILGQTSLVRHAGRRHNLAREARADCHRQQAETGFTWRNRYLGMTTVTATAITSGMIWRGVAALGDASFGITGLLIFVAVVTGLLMPILGYLGVALDGSKVSRERDGLAAHLNKDLDAYLETIKASRQDLDDATEIGDTLKNRTFPEICHVTQETVEGAYGLYATVRLLIGGLSADPPARSAMKIEQDADGNLRAFIGTSIPGTRQVNLDSLFDRLGRLHELERQDAGLRTLIDALPPHPWGKPRTR